MTARCTVREAVFGDELDDGVISLTASQTETREAAIMAASPVRLAGGTIVVHEADCLLILYETPGECMAVDDERCTCCPLVIEPERGWDN